MWPGHQLDPSSATVQYPSVNTKGVTHSWAVLGIHPVGQIFFTRAGCGSCIHVLPTEVNCASQPVLLRQPCTAGCNHHHTKPWMWYYQGRETKVYQNNNNNNNNGSARHTARHITTTWYNVAFSFRQATYGNGSLILLVVSNPSLANKPSIVWVSIWNAQSSNFWQRIPVPLLLALRIHRGLSADLADTPLLTTGRCLWFRHVWETPGEASRYKTDHKATRYLHRDFY